MAINSNLFGNAPQITYSGINSAITNKTTFTTSNGETVSVDDMHEFMKVMKQRMLILDPLFTKHEHYPALKDAYENYLMIERLCMGSE